MKKADIGQRFESPTTKGWSKYITVGFTSTSKIFLTFKIWGFKGRTLKKILRLRLGVWRGVKSRFKENCKNCSYLSFAIIGRIIAIAKRLSVIES